MPAPRSHKSRPLSAGDLQHLPFTAREIYAKLESERPELLARLADEGELAETLSVSGDTLLESFFRKLRKGEDVETALMYVRMEMDDLPLFRQAF